MRYSERLTAPPHYWIVGILVGISFVTAVGFYLGPWVALAATVVTMVGIALFLWWIGRTLIVVDAEGVRVGPSLLEWPFVGATAVLDAAGARRRLGRDADVRAHVVERPYIRGAVEVAVADAADPHPYWLVSTRRPAELALAIDQGRRRAAGAIA